MIDHHDTHPFPDDSPRALRTQKQSLLRPRHTWVAIGVGVGSMVVGGAVSMAGQKKQEKANQKALEANQAQQAEQNRIEWSNYLMQRGIAPTQSVEPGVLPTSGYRAVNTRMPLWMTMSRERAQPSGSGAAKPPSNRRVIGYRRVSS